MRELSDFFERLKFGFLSGITESVKGNPDLNLEIRENSSMFTTKATLC